MLAEIVFLGGIKLGILGCFIEESCLGFVFVGSLELCLLFCCCYYISVQKPSLAEIRIG